MEISGRIPTSFTPQLQSQNPKNSLNRIGIRELKSEVKQQDQNFERDRETEENVSKDQLKEVIKGVNEFLTPAETSLKFTLHEDLQEYYVKIIDDKTKEVIREIPPKKLLDMYAAMKEYLGLIVDRKI